MRIKFDGEQAIHFLQTLCEGRSALVSLLTLRRDVVSWRVAEAGRMRARYLERRDALIDALKQELGDLLDVAIPEAGMSLTAWLPDGMSDQAVARRAAELDLGVTPISTFCQEPYQRGGLLFGFASAPPQALRAGVQTFARAFREQQRDESASAG